MAARVLLTPQAEAEIEAIGDYIATDNQAAALRMVRRLRGRCAALDTFPERGTRVGERHRALVEGPYLIIYRVDPTTDPETVIIVTVVHGARDWGQLGEW